MRYRHNEYKVVEEYLNEKIEVKVDECWHRGKLLNAEVYCLNSKMLNFLDSDLTPNVIDNLIAENILFAEKLISDSRNVIGNDLSVPREVYVVKEYERQMIDIKLIVNMNEDTIGMCLPSMDNEPVTYDKSLVRDKLCGEIKRCKMIINDGGILPTPDFLSDEKGKSFTKKIFK